MTKRGLAIGLASSMVAVAAVNILLALGLALDHRAFVAPLASLTACIPGFVVAALAWRDRLPVACKASRSEPPRRA